MANFDKYGQIIRQSTPAVTQAQAQHTQARPALSPTPAAPNKARDSFNKVTISLSPILYGAYGLFFNSFTGLNWHPVLAIFGGALVGFLATVINNFVFERDAEGNAFDYVMSLGTPAIAFTLLDLLIK